MKFPNYLKNVFAGLGIVSLIFYTCAAESSSDNSSNLPQITGGTYQVEHLESDQFGNKIVVINTQTGVMITYASNNSGGNWTEQTQSTITFTH